MEDLVPGIWPGERLVGRSGARRLHVAVSKLRAAGLGRDLQHRPPGYRISPALGVALVPGGTLAGGEDASEPPA